ncbi:MAG: hypothetical protein ABFS45_20545, partial [Pseudomonadota bacterium]
MKIITLFCSGAFLLLASTMVIAENSVKVPGLGGWENDPYALEPCMNGGVSQTGLYPSQEIEIAAFEFVADKQVINKDTSFIE